MRADIVEYNEKQTTDYKAVCFLLAKIIDLVLVDAESKIWHSHPVWFIEGTL
jgi:hypothetical protein